VPIARLFEGVEPFRDGITPSGYRFAEKNLIFIYNSLKIGLFLIK